MTSLTVSSNVELQLVEISRQLAELKGELARQRAERQVWADLVGDAGPLARQALDEVGARLQKVDVAAYAEFARGGAGVLDKVVSTFGEDDLHALGDNVVLILQTVKEMTQPEVMGLLQRTAVELREHPDEPAVPPSLFHLVRELRDPEVRRGLARLMTILRSVGDDEPAHDDDRSPEQEVAR